jgi:MerR family transcriptional regulator, light-induced transcriptional regulator
MTVYRHVRTGQLPAILEGARWTVDVADLAQFDQTETTPKKRRNNLVDRVGRLKDRMVAGDNLGSWAVIEGAMSSGMEPSAVYVDLLVPTLEQIGDDWGSGAISVAEEHRASVVAMRMIGRLGPRFARRGRPRGSVILGTPPGEQHGIPVLILADLLRSARFEPLDLGANTPSESFVETALNADRLVAVLIGATTTGRDASVREVIRALKKARVTAAILVGGRAIVDGDHARRLGATGWTGRHGTDAVLAVEELSAAHR